MSYYVMHYSSTYPFVRVGGGEGMVYKLVRCKCIPNAAAGGCEKQ